MLLRNRSRDIRQSEPEDQCQLEGVTGLIEIMEVRFTTTDLKSMGVLIPVSFSGSLAGWPVLYLREQANPPTADESV